MLDSTLFHMLRQLSLLSDIALWLQRFAWIQRLNYTMVGNRISWLTALCVFDEVAISALTEIGRRTDSVQVQTSSTR